MLNNKYKNIRDICYIYSLNFFKIINKNIDINKLKKFLKLLIIITKNKFLFKFYLNNKIFFLKTMFYILKKYIFLDFNIKKILKILLKDKMLYNIKFIYFYLIKIYQKKYNILNVIVYISYNINYENINLIKKNIINKFINKKINFFFKKNKNIIAGFKIYINDYVIDCSLLRNIKKINFIFNKNLIE